MNKNNNDGKTETGMEKILGAVNALEIKIEELENELAKKSLSEKSFRSIVENNTDTIMRFDKNDRHLYVNAKVESDTGIPAEKFIGKTHAEMGFPKALVHIWESAISKVFRTGKENRIEFQLPTGIWIDWLLIPEFNKNNDVETVLTSAREITDKKEIELELLNERYLLQTFMDNVPDHIYFKDIKGRFTTVNKAQAQWLGVNDPKELSGKTDLDFFSDYHANQAREDELKIQASGGTISKEEKETWKDGRTTWVNTVKMPLYDADGNITGTFGISRDITSRKQTMFALAESERRYRRLTENAQDIIWRTSIDGEILFINSVGVIRRQE